MRCLIAVVPDFPDCAGSGRLVPTRARQEQRFVLQEVGSSCFGTLESSEHF